MHKLYFLFFLLTLSSCHKIKRAYTYDDIDFKAEMRKFVIHISDYGKIQKPGFIIIAQNGVELLTTTGQPDAPLHRDYLNALEGQSQEGLFFGYNTINEPTPVEKTQYLKKFLTKFRLQDKSVLVTDYCFEPDVIQASRDSVKNNNFIGFQAPDVALNIIPAVRPYHENNADILNLNQAQNYLYLINYEGFSSKSILMEKLSATNYDVLILDLFFDQNTPFTSNDIQRLKTKANGGQRLVISYLSIGEAEDYRYYWQPHWVADPPIWLDEENPEWDGNYKVRYWEPGWQKIIYGNNQSYLKKIISAGFDGAFLDLIDAYEFFENKTNY